MIVSETEELDRGARSFAAEIQDSPAYPQIFAEARDKQTDILTPKGETETLSIQNINIAETEEMSEPVELERAASCSTAEVEEPQSRLVFQTSLKGSMSNLTSYFNSLKGSPVPLSRYHSAPSVLGISALLNDHLAPEIKGLNAVTLSPRHAVSPSFPLSEKDMLHSPVSTMRQSLTPHLKEIRSEATSIPQSRVTPRSQTSQGKVTPPSPPPQPMPSTLTPKLNDFTPRVPPPPSPPPPPTPYAMSSTKAMSSFMLHENSPAAPQLPLSVPGSELATNCCSSSVPVPPSPPSFSQQGTQHAAPTSLVPAPPPLPPPALIEKESVPDIIPHFPLDSSIVPKPPPPPPPHLMLKESKPVLNQHSPPVPPLPAPFFLTKAGSASLTPHPSGNSQKIPPPAPPLGTKGRMQPRSIPRNLSQSKKSNLKPYHWLKLTRAVQGSLWAEAQKSEEASQTPDINMSELESLFAASVPSGHGSTAQRSSRRTSGPKSEKVNLIELRRAYNCEIMLTKVKVPLHELATSILALDDSSLDGDQVENLIKFCPKKEEMEILKNYTGDKENLGKCEQFFLELMKVPRVESKLRVFAFKIQFCSQVSDLMKDLNVINSACEEVRNSVKLKRIMQTILSLGNALNQGTARGSAVGFRLDSLLKLTDTRSRNNKMTLMHYLCKVLSENLPELLNFPDDLCSLEAATKIQLKYLAEEMQAVSKGLEKVIQELTLSENDGSVSDIFCKSLMKFLPLAEGEVRSLASLYSGVGRNADALSLYFGEDPARVPFEQVVSTLRNFVTMFIRAHEENCKQIELEKKKAQKEADEKAKLDSNQKVTIISDLQEHLVK
ncbi:hypothetical protein Leryth_004625 [Lithospermum erythrorhizon]|nr:hypothetical protein Leryth_004625 [Lithospermum erythrorhizon]